MDADDDGGSGDDMVLRQAVQTKLPRGSTSPDKLRSPSPERPESMTLRMATLSPEHVQSPAARGTSTNDPSNCE